MPRCSTSMISRDSTTLSGRCGVVFPAKNAKSELASRRPSSSCPTPAHHDGVGPQCSFKGGCSERAVGGTARTWDVNGMIGGRVRGPGPSCDPGLSVASSFCPTTAIVCPAGGQHSTCDLEALRVARRDALDHPFRASRARCRAGRYRSSYVCQVAVRVVRGTTGIGHFGTLLASHRGPGSQRARVVGGGLACRSKDSPGGRQPVRGPSSPPITVSALWRCRSTSWGDVALELVGDLEHQVAGVVRGSRRCEVLPQQDRDAACAVGLDCPVATSSNQRLPQLQLSTEEGLSRRIGGWTTRRMSPGQRARPRTHTDRRSRHPSRWWTPTASALTSSLPVLYAS